MTGPAPTKLLAVVAALAAMHAGCGSTTPNPGIAPAGQAGQGTAGAAAGQGGQETGAAGTPQDAGGASGGGGATGTDAGPDGGDSGGPAGTGGPRLPTTKNYQLSGSWPALKAAVATMPGQLTYKKIVIQNQFLAESCAIGDYDNDGIPDVSSGRIWYQGTADPATTFKIAHVFRSGHGALPRNGDGPEIDTGVSDDWADFAFDVDGDGWTDIINVASPDVDDVKRTNPTIGSVQPHATAFWYKNPGPALAGDPIWAPTLMHNDVRLEQHLATDMNGDGFPEILGACKTCDPATTKGYYQGDPADPTKRWSFHSVTVAYTFPFGGFGWLKGIGANDVNGDGRPDLLERGGAWLQGPNGTWGTTPCASPTAVGCWVKTSFYDGLPDSFGHKGPSHMFAADMDGDGLTDVVAADWAYGEGLFWYRQTEGLTFKKLQFMGNNLPADTTKWGAGFTSPVAMQVVDMDGDGAPDVVTGKMRFPQPHGYQVPDADGTPYVYVFKNVAETDARTGSPITLKPHLVDGDPTQPVGSTAGGLGVGRQIGIGHVNTDGIIDICVATKVGLAVFLGQ